MDRTSRSESLSYTASVQLGTITKATPAARLSLEKISVASFTFCLALVLFCIYRSISLSELSYNNTFSSIASLISYSVIGLLVVKILLFSRYNIIEIALYLVLCAIAIIGANNNNSTYPIFLILFIIGARDINVSVICRIALVAIIVCLITIMLLSLTGLIGNRTAYQNSNLLGETVLRQAFGFTQYNNIGQLSLAAFACYVCLRYKKFGILDVCLCLIWAAFLFFGVSSRTAPILMLIGVLFIYLSRVITFKIFFGICAILGIITIIAALLTAYYYDPTNSFMVQINSLFSGRVNFAHSCFVDYSITPFGQYIDFSGTGLILDNAYVSLLFRYGVFGFIAVMALFVYAFIKSYKYHLLPVIIILTIMLFVGFAEIWIYTIPGVIVLSIAFGKHSDAIQNASVSRGEIK